MTFKRNYENILKSGIVFSGTQIIAIGFIMIILAGALLLTLPLSSRTGEWTPFIDAIFTATTSTCVTGLVVYDTFTHWSLFGQIVILVLIQTGGLGFMAIAALFSMALNKRISMKQRLVMSESISLESLGGIVRLMRKIMLCTIAFEGTGALLLATRFIPEFGVANGIYKAVFHSVSAFCNAGIDLMGEREAFSSFVHFAGDGVVNFTICALVITGGLGFYVWEDLWHFFRDKRRLRLHTKLVIVITASLCVFATVCFFIFEYSNPATMKNMTLYEKFLASVFQAVTIRTAGFNTIDFAAMNGASMIVTLVLMFIGGSPGSTAGGIKTTTFGVLLLTARAVTRGAPQVHIWGRRITDKQVLRALAIVVISMALVCTGAAILCAIENITIEVSLFEVVSAFATVGLTLGITTGLSDISKIVIILLMYLGRVGVLTAVFAIAKKQYNYENKISYPKETVLF